MNCARPGGCRQPYGCGKIQRCWWETIGERERHRRPPGLPRGPVLAVDPNRAEPGYWLIRLVRRGPWVPACIRWVITESEPGCPENDMRGTRSAHLAAFVMEEPADLYRVWTTTKLAYIDEREYRFRCQDAAWVKKHAPEEALARPREAVDLLNHPPPRF